MRAALCTHGTRMGLQVMTAPLTLRASISGTQPSHHRFKKKRTGNGTLSALFRIRIRFALDPDPQ